MCVDNSLPAQALLDPDVTRQDWIAFWSSLSPGQRSDGDMNPSGTEFFLEQVYFLSDARLDEWMAIEDLSDGLKLPTRNLKLSFCIQKFVSRKCHLEHCVI